LLWLLRLEMQFATRVLVFKALYHIVAGRGKSNVEAMIRGRFLDAIEENFEEVVESLEDEIVDSMTAILNFGEEEWTGFVIAHETLVSGLVKIVTLPEDFRALLLDLT